MNRILSFFLISVSLFIGCTGQPDQHGVPVASIPLAKQKVLPDTLRPPVIVYPQNCPAPIKIFVPDKEITKHIQVNGRDTLIRLQPPKINPFDFYVTMPNYNTEQGLSLSSVGCAFRDTKGNLWFGTQGGGVSRYDGKTFTNFTTAQGLGENTIWAITEDRNGNLWFGTEGAGVSCYNGRNFTTFTTSQGLCHNTVLAVQEDKNGILWFGTKGGGVSRYDPRALKNPFTTYTTADGLGNNCILSIAKDKAGDLWFGTNGGGVSRCNPERMAHPGNKKNNTGEKLFITYTMAEGLVNNHVWAILEDRSGELWFGTDGGVSCYDPPEKGNGKCFKNYTTDQGLANNYVLCITEDKTGNLWFGTEGGGVSCYDRQSSRYPNAVPENSFTNFTLKQGLANNTVFSITEDNSGNLWFGTNGGGLSRYDGKSFMSFTTVQGMANNLIWGITEDKKGDIWFCTHGGGVCRYSGNTENSHDTSSRNLKTTRNSFTNFDKSQGLLTDIIFNVKEDKSGKLWFGTNGGGVSCYDPQDEGKHQEGSFTTYTSAQGLAGNIVWSIEEDRTGALWFGTDGGGVSRYIQGTQAPLNFDKSPEKISFTNFTKEQGLANNTVWCIKEDKKGDLWFATNGGGISRYTSHGKEVPLKIGSSGASYFTNFTTSEGLPTNFVISILEDEEENLWFGTNGGGVCRFDPKGKNGTFFTSFTTTQGLSSDIVTAIAKDKKGNILFGTSSGFTVLKGFRTLKAEARYNRVPASNRLSNAELKKYEPIFEVYNNKTGFPVKDININSMFVDSHGVIWAGTGDKLVRFDYDEIRMNKEPPKVVIQSLKINNENICWYDLHPGFEIPANANITEEATVFGRVLTEALRDSLCKKFGDIHFDAIDAFYPLPRNLILPYRHNNVTFSFSAIEPARPYLVKYQYFLEGYDNQWNPVTDNSSATYGNIREGKYTFYLRAQSPEGIWCKPVSYVFKVLPPWFRTWWAYVMYLLMAALAVGAFVNYRVRALRKEKISLEKKVEDRTQQLKEQKTMVEKQKVEVEKQKALIEEKQTKILDSINYARRIQDALLKKENQTNKHLPAHVVLFKAKDIVSGDFYWSLEKNGYWYIAAVDCTGHGVPGAFLSLLGVAFLNEINASSEVLSPAQILEQLRSKIVGELCQTGSEEEGKEGMDISLLRIDLETKEAQWSGAYNSLYILGSEGLREIKADRQPIGYYPLPLPFTNHSFQLKTDENLYLFTDGYADQQNKDKVRIARTRFKELLETLKDMSVETQREQLNNFLFNWKESREQTDDICVICIRI
jgi:ligand-binding sensor domain-containing protein/serine phosphatase RsbU (regulator of sigma subunit)